MPPPLHEIVLDYKMAADKIMTSSDTQMTKLCALISQSIEFSELMSCWL